MDVQKLKNESGLKGPNSSEMASALRNFGQAASNNIAETVSTPIDAIAWALRKAGVPVGNAPVMGSEWMAQKGLTRPTQEGVSKMAGDFVGLVSPLAFEKQVASKLAGALRNGLPKNAPVGNMFIGESANTWDAVSAAQAKALEKQGKTPQEIWKETGTFKGVDGKYRQEIPDNTAQMVGYKGLPVSQSLPKSVKETGGGFYSQSDLISHPKLFSAYPEFENLGVKFLDMNGNGQYNASTKDIFLDKELAKQQAKSTNLHELQHAIQHKEGFARGGSPESLAQEVFDAKENFNKYDSLRQRAYDAASQEAAWKIKDPAYADIIKNEMAKHEATLGLKSADNPFGVDEQQALSWYLANEKGAPRYAELANQNRMLSGMDASQAYKHLAGEAEARAVQARMNMTPEQRRATFPLDSYDIPVNQLIVK